MEIYYDNVKKFDNILNSCRTSSKVFNFQQMGEIKSKYNVIESNIDTFLTRYALAIEAVKNIKKQDPTYNKYYSLQQRNRDIKPLILDIDVSKKSENKKQLDKVPKKLITNEKIKHICHVIARLVDSMYGIKNPNICVFDRKNASYKKDGSVKDGIHICVPNIITNKDELQYLLNESEKLLCAPIFGSLAEFENPIDRCVLTGPWLLYGSSKDGTHTYDITHIYENGEVKNFKSESITTINKVKNFNLFIDPKRKNKIINSKIQEIITLNGSHKKTTVKILGDIIISDKINNKYTNDNVKTFEKVLNLYNKRRYEDYILWRNIIFCIASVTEKDKRFYDIVKRFSMKSKKFNEGGEEIFNNLWDSAASINSYERNTYKSLNPLFNWLYEDLVTNASTEIEKQKGRQQYFELRNKETHYKIINHFGQWCDDDIASLMYDKLKNKYKAIIIGRETIIHEFVDHIWKECQNKGSLKDFLVKDMVDLFKNCIDIVHYKKMKDIDTIPGNNVGEKKHMIKVGILMRVIASLKTVTSQNNYIKAFENKVRDDYFYENSNQNMNLFAFKNGIFDRNKMIFRPGKPEDMITIQCKVNYIGHLMKHIEKDKEKMKMYSEINTYFIDLFPDQLLRYYIIGELSKCFWGNRTEHNAYICSGVGRNGKSALFTILSRNFGKHNYYNKIDIGMLTQKRKDYTSPDAQMHAFEKARIVVTSEPDTNVSFNLGILKELVGADDTTFRPLYAKKVITFQPQSRLFIHVNNPPKLNEVGVAIRERLKFIPFITRFIDPTHDLKEYKNRYEHVCKQDRNIFDKFDRWTDSGMFMFFLLNFYTKYVHGKKTIIPKIVTAATDNYVRRNDSIADFIDEELVYTRDTMNNIIELSYLYIRFRDFLKTRGIYKCVTDINQLSDYIKTQYGKLAIKNKQVLGFEFKGNDDLPTIQIPKN